MVMIDLSDEKKSLGVISVTRVTGSFRLSHPPRTGSLAFSQFNRGGLGPASDRAIPIGQLAPVKKK
jgi:hypothetical protein